MQPISKDRTEILIVDDDFSIREMLVQMLEDEGYQVSSAENGKVALDYLRAATRLPCLILLDLKMPIMDGAEFRSRQMQDTRLSGIPVLLLTADQNIHMDRANALVANVLAKPIKLNVLLEVIKRKGC